MAARRYFSSSIVELEQLFESSKGDRSVLEGLRDELEHRNTNHAKALAKKVDDHLALLETHYRFSR